MNSAAQSRSGRLAGGSGSRALTVCVVDPHPEDYQAWRGPRRAGGESLQVIGSAEEALRVARSRHIDLWVINTELPGLSGLELCSMLKAKFSRTAVYLVANEYTLEAEQAAWQARATLFGCKPMHADWLNHWFNSTADQTWVAPPHATSDIR